MGTQNSKTSQADQECSAKGKPPRFMDVLAINPKHKDSTTLDYLDPSCEDIIKDCEVQFLEDYMCKKKLTLVNGDNTSDIIQAKASLKLFLKALARIFNEQYGNLELLEYFKSTIKDNPERQKYFEEKGLSRDEAFACAWLCHFIQDTMVVEILQAIK